MGSCLKLKLHILSRTIISLALIFTIFKLSSIIDLVVLLVYSLIILILMRVRVKRLLDILLFLAIPIIGILAYSCIVIKTYFLSLLITPLKILGFAYSSLILISNLSEGEILWLCSKLRRNFKLSFLILVILRAVNILSDELMLIREGLWLRGIYPKGFKDRVKAYTLLVRNLIYRSIIHASGVAAVTSIGMLNIKYLTPIYYEKVNLGINCLVLTITILLLLYLTLPSPHHLLKPISWW